MLRTLSIRNFAIIERLNLEFGPGLNVLTGETGAGKSILMDALNLVLGSRAGSEMVRGGEERAILDAVFDISDSPEFEQILDDMGFELEEGQLFLTREVTAAGKSSCRVCGRPASVSQLKEIGDWLVDLHGQHDHQALLAVPRHLDMLDEWGGKELQAWRNQVSVTYQELARLRREKESMETDARERSHQLDLYQFQVKEITEAKLKPGEDVELDEEYKKIANGHKLAESAEHAASLLGGGETGNGTIDMLQRTIKLLEDAASIDKTLAESLETVKNAYYELSETERDLKNYHENFEFDAERQEIIEERIELIRTLKRKYGEDMLAVLRFCKETEAKLNNLTHSEERGEQLSQEMKATEKRLTQCCARLSEMRKIAAKLFRETTLIELSDLGMNKTRFEVQIETGEPTAKGIDRVEFQIATNPGEPMRSLAKVASGGEISRVTLAIKSALARQESLPTMVFDEIDVGVGGRTASVIADKLTNLARTVQIICITHLAQIAGRGDRHYYIEKFEADNRTAVTVTPLTPEERVAEVARMIGGANVTDAVLQHAREMLTVT